MSQKMPQLGGPNALDNNNDVNNNVATQRAIQAATAGQAVDGITIFPSGVITQHLQADEMYIGDNATIKDGYITGDMVAADTLTSNNVQTGSLVVGDFDTSATDLMFDTAAAATGVQGWGADGGFTFIDGGDLFNDSVTTAALAANAVTANEIAAGAVTIGKMADTRGFYEDFQNGLDTVGVWAKGGAGTYQTLSADADATFGATLLETTGYMTIYGYYNPIPFDPNVLYRSRIRLRYTGNKGYPSPMKVYAGVSCRDKDKAPCATGSSNGNIYDLFSSVNPTDDSWMERTVFIKGYHATTYRTGALDKPQLCTQVHPDTKFLAPLVLIDYSDPANLGVWEIDYFIIEPMLDDNSIMQICIADDYTKISSTADGSVPTTGIILGDNQIRLRKGGVDNITLDGDTGDGTFRGSVEVGGLPGSDGAVIVYDGEANEVARIGYEDSNVVSRFSALTASSVEAPDVTGTNQVYAGKSVHITSTGTPNDESPPSSYPIGHSIQTVSAAGGWGPLASGAYGVVHTWRFLDSEARTYQEFWPVVSEGVTYKRYTRFWNVTSLDWNNWYETSAWTELTGSGGGGGGPYVYTATMSRSYRYSSSSWRTDDYLTRQGSWGYGNHAGIYIFPAAAYSYSTVSNIRIYLYRYNGGGYSSAVTPYLYTHNYSSIPGGAPTLTNYFAGTALARGAGAWMSPNWESAWAGGTAKGFGIMYNDANQYDQDAEYFIGDTYLTAKVEITT